MNIASPASVHSDADSAALWAAMLVASPHSDPTRTTNGAWVGYHDMHAEGCAAGCATDCTDFGFIWTDGSPSDYEYWSDGEPNDWNGSAADCTVTLPTAAMMTAPRDVAQRSSIGTNHRMFVIPAHFRARCVEVSSAGAGPVRRAGVRFATSCASSRQSGPA